MIGLTYGEISKALDEGLSGFDSVPYHEHDCEACIYLGYSFVEDLGKLVNTDYYFCPEGKDIIARFSSDGPDYASMPVGFPVDIILNPYLAHGVLLALKMGLIKMDEINIGRRR
jgi:hypothetical protein